MHALEKIERERTEALNPENYDEDEERNREKIYHIEELSLSGNTFEAAGIEGLKNHSSHLKVLALDKCSFERAAFDNIFELCFEAKELKVLSLEFNNLGNSCVKKLLSGLATKKSLIYLNLKENQLTNEVMSDVVYFLTDNHIIECLELDRNT
jgi:Leucine-rich repeat (LRR) protein